MSIRPLLSVLLFLALGLFTVHGASAQTCSLPPSGLVGWWPGDGTTADMVGDNHASLAGATYAPGVVDQAFSFDGVDDFVAIPTTAFADLSSGTISFWFKTGSSRTQQSALFSYTTSNGVSNLAEGMIVIDQRSASTPQALIARIGTTTNGWDVNIPTATFDARTNLSWNHLVIVQDGVNPRVYLNGTLVGTNNRPAPFDLSLVFEDALSPGVFDFATLGALFRVGVPAATYFHGFIDELAIWDRALSDTEITDIFNAGSNGMCKQTPGPGPSGTPVDLFAQWTGDGTTADALGTYDGAANGGVGFTEGVVGPAFRFDGGNDYIRVGESANLKLAAHTVTAWIRMVTLPSSSGYVVYFTGQVTNGGIRHNTAFQITPPGRLDYAHGLGNSQGEGVIGATTLQAGVWYHVSYVVDGSQLHVYVNGVLDGSVAGGFPAYDSAFFNVSIGARSFGLSSSLGGWVGSYFKGNIDDLALWDRALTQSEIQDIYDAGKWGLYPPSGNTPAGNTIVVLPEDETTGQTPVTTTFSDVGLRGNTTLTTASTGPPPPTGLRLGSPPVYYDLTTTAVFTGTIEVCINYSDAAYGNENRLRLLHRENNAWVDRTTSLDTANDIICASVTSFSEFTVVEEEAISIAGTVTSNCAGPLEGVAVTLQDGEGADHSATTGVDGVFLFEGINTSETPGQLSVTVPADLDPAGNTQSITLDAAGTYDFTFGCLVNVSGTVSSVCQGVLEGITVDLIDAAGEMFTTPTDADGAYTFEGIAYSTEEGEISVVAPVGFSASVPTDGHAALTFDTNQTVPFTLECVQAVEPARSMGFWKHQANVHLKGKGHAHESETDMASTYPSAIFNRFYENSLNDIEVTGVTYIDEGAGPVPITLETIRSTLTVNRGGTKLDRAKQQYLAMLLNIASLRLQSHTVVSADGATASHALQYIASLINDGDGSNDETAKSIADEINNGEVVATGVIPEDIDFVAYSRYESMTPSAFLGQNSPNPMRAATTMRFALGAPGSYTLRIFSIDGRLVRTFAGSTQGEAVSVNWNGADDQGQKVSAGVYFYRLDSAQFVQTRRMILIR